MLWDKVARKFFVSRDVIFDEISATEGSEGSHGTLINENSFPNNSK